MLALAAPASARPSGDILDILVGEGDLLDKLIALDAEGIADMHEGALRARDEIDRAADDIRGAREDLRQGRGNRFVVMALSVAAEELDSVVGEAIGAAYAEIDVAERDLETADVSPEERDETRGAIDGLRFDLEDIENSLGRLMDELRE